MAGFFVFAFIRFYFWRDETGGGSIPLFRASTSSVGRWANVKCATQVTPTPRREGTERTSHISKAQRIQSRDANATNASASLAVTTDSFGTSIPSLASLPFSVTSQDADDEPKPPRAPIIPSAACRAPPPAACPRARHTSVRAPRRPDPQPPPPNYNHAPQPAGRSRLPTT